MMAGEDRPLVVHVMHRFDTGGLENGVVNLINRMPSDEFRHAVVALTEVTAFRNRIRRADVEFRSMSKPPGQTARIFPDLWRLFRSLKPAIVHTRNLGALEVNLPAWAAGVRVRIHSEHGWDVDDPKGLNPKHRMIRRAFRPFVTHYVALSGDIARYLSGPIGVGTRKLTHICNGVDLDRFSPRSSGSTRPDGFPFAPESWIVGTVGRMQPVKDQLNLARAFVSTLRKAPRLRESLRLVMVGDGPLLEHCRRLLAEAGVDQLAWLPGARSDIPELLACFDCFVLPSLAEGISNTILEAMACGLPVIATDVGGNGELVSGGHTGLLVPAADPDSLADAIITLATDRDRARAMGAAARRLAENKFSLDGMIQSYRDLYRDLLRPAAAERTA